MWRARVAHRVPSPVAARVLQLVFPGHDTLCTTRWHVWKSRGQPPTNHLAPELVVRDLAQIEEPLERLLHHALDVIMRKCPARMRTREAQ